MVPATIIFITLYLCTVHFCAAIPLAQFGRVQSSFNLFLISTKFGSPSVVLPGSFHLTKAGLQIHLSAAVSKETDNQKMDQRQLDRTISDIVGNPLAVAAARLRGGDSTPVQNEELLTVSSYFEELFGYSRQELKGKSILRLLSMTGMADPQLEIYLNMVQQGIRSVPGVQVPLRRKTGELVDSTVFIQKAKLPGDLSPHWLQWVGWLGLVAWLVG